MTLNLYDKKWNIENDSTDRYLKIISWHSCEKLNFSTCDSNTILY